MAQIDWTKLAGGTPPARRPAQTSAPAATLASNSGYRVELVGGSLEFYSPYNAGLVSALKNAIPYTHRTWDGTRRCWKITPDYADALADIVGRVAGVKLQLPSSTPRGAVAVESRLIDVRYVGRIKSREDGSENAFGWSGGQWSVIFPKTVLLEWFGAIDRPGASGTLYAVLGITPEADDKTIKSAYRRAARSWHPDVSSEPDAAEQFIRIQAAYDILSNPTKRAKYAAGLALSSSVKIDTDHRSEYAPPVRCGLLHVEGTDRLGRFVVAKILQWEDIVNSRGETLVTSWPVGADTFQERWTA